MPENCRERIVSEDYVDFIWKSSWNTRELAQIFPNVCIQIINDFYATFYVNAEYLQNSSRVQYEYDVFPSLYTLQENADLEASNIIYIQNQPVLNLRGEGVIMGFVDTGIDYTNACFRDASGNSRVVEIWDQTIQTGQTPKNIGYGSVYTREEINQALQSEDPFSMVPSRDELGHGTQIASIAAGSRNEATGWIGAAPQCDIAVVKLKPAKKYLKEYFAVRPDAIAFQENDIMLAVRYLLDLALRQGKPLVICMSLGSNMGGHEGNSPLSSYLNTVGSRTGCCVVSAAGNEANQGHHFYGMLRDDQEFETVELRVAENEYGLMMELWGSTPDLLSVSLTSPTGEEIPRISFQNRNQRFTFLFERAVVYVDFQPLEARSGDQLIVIRMFAPTPGIWRLHVYGTHVVAGCFNIWLPVTGFISEETRFLNSNPDITLTEPANADIPITVGAYQSDNNSIYINSSRGYTRKGRIKPDIAAPGVDIPSFAPGDRATVTTGTSAAAAVAAGAAALMMEWGIVRGNRMGMGTVEIKQLFIRGARRTTSTLYPNRSWGYGMLDLYASFVSLGRF
ncbi:MAG: S8 family peptidase [Lachnospiraceae bacterium]|jgi:subtilisin family serine protease|nr:S8 family peptidase [Lachnospiraceae bacterium]MCI8995485.1 S8 family peptidase [Lachnospiraceae bacterium]MCI9134240.1 S8 family peptidase [Lachnospiraceae bacterium]